MPRLKTPGVAAIDMPARTNIAAVAQIGRVESQTSDHCEHVTGTGLNREPAAAAALAVTKKIARRQRLLEHPGVMERKRNRAGTIVTVIVKRSVSPAPNVRVIADCVDRPGYMFNRFGHVRRHCSSSVPRHRPP